MADALKDQGNKAFAAKKYDEAIDLFTQAIALDPSNHVLFSNRSAAKAGLRQWKQALEDAEQTVKLKPSWGKGYARKGAALHGAKRFDDAIAAYEAGLKVEDSPALRKGLEEVKDAKETNEFNASGGMGLGKMFSDPSLIAKLATNPRTAKHLADPAFMQKLKMFQSNPILANNALSDNDPRMIDVLGVAMGIDMQGFNRPEGSDDLPPSFTKQEDLPSTPSASTPPSKPQPTSAKPAPQPEAPAADVEMTEIELEQTEAEAAKKLGSEAYKKRDFESAVKNFQKAWDLWPKDMTFLTNLGAVYFEQGEYDKCIQTCEKAVEEGRSLRSDYKLIAKALGRIGSAYAKKEDHVNAIKYYQKSLTEFRTPDVLNKLRDIEKAKLEADKKAYIDVDKSAAAREEGNVQFKAGDFAGAVKSYTESIKRDPSDARGYNNRANAYTKLAAFPEALKDADEAIKVDPKFVKGYIRKSHVLFAMREPLKALQAIQEAEEHDTDHKHKSEIRAQDYKCQEALSEQRSGESQEETLQRAMRDPEIASIMNDPVMQQILQQAQSNPGALQDHMKNPGIRDKVMKLINAGIIRTR